MTNRNLSALSLSALGLSALGLCLLLALAGCSEDPPCPAGSAPAEWSAPPLVGLLPQGVHVCQGASATSLTYWQEDTVHRANMDSVGAAQDHGWSRTGDNWYGTRGDFNTPKWSELANASGRLRIDVHEQNGGATVQLQYTPGPGAAAGVADTRTDLQRAQDALRQMPRPAPRPSAPSVAPNLAAPLTVPATAGRLGGANAPVVLHVFFDYQSPFDSRFVGNLDRLHEEYGDRVLIVIRNNPLPFHRDAAVAARAALAVRMQRGDEAFWRYQATLFQNQRQLDPASLTRYAAAIEGLDVARFTTDMNGPDTQAAVQADQSAAQMAGARGTPATILGTTIIMGAQPYERVKAAVDAALAG